MKARALLWAVAANLGALIVLVFDYPEFMISPGAPIAAHADLARDCFACHTPLLGSRPAKCLECHPLEDIGIRTTRGLAIDKEKKNVAFHQKLVESDCVACHSDHRGVNAFRPIGQFSHELLQVSVRTYCEQCHDGPEDALHRKITGGCAECHTESGWLPATFDHTRHFRFDRDHETDCDVCHLNNDYAQYTCYGCHEHSRSNIREEHVEEGIFEYEECVECHRSADEDEAERLWRSKRLDWPQRGGGGARSGRGADRDDD